MPDWRILYDDMARRLPALARSAPLTLCGFCACVDRILDHHVVVPQLLADGDPHAIALGQALLLRAMRGIGGELCVAWPGGPAWLDRCEGRASLGGTAAQAAQALALLGAPVLLALQDRSAAQLALIHPDVLVASKAGPVAAGSLRPTEACGKLPHYIFEYTAGRAVAGVIPPRSTRVIVRFGDDGMEEDPDFAEHSVPLARAAGAAILAGFNAVPLDRQAHVLGESVKITKAWRDAGLALIHLELGDFPRSADRDATLAALAGSVSSIGMNHNELRALLPGEEAPEIKALLLAARLGAERVCVHDDQWALTVTRRDPAAEFEALLAGCLLAATRAATGGLAVPRAAPIEAVYAQPPSVSPLLPEGWHVVSCGAPFLRQPATTLGLGDTFLAGTMLALGQSTGWARRGELRSLANRGYA